MTDPRRGHDAPPLQDLGQLEEFWSEPDPWAYETTEDDELRARRLISSLPQREYSRTLDIGCGNGFLTHRLPGDEVIGVDVAAPAIEWARARVADRPDAERFRFEPASVFDLDAAALGRFELVVITGVLYPQYIGGAFTAVTETVRSLCEPGAIVVSVQIDDWFRHRFPWISLAISVDAYREYTHRLEVFEVR